jgi:hypothetical protein
MKQGGFDGLVACVALACAASASWRARARSTLLIAAGALIPIGAALIHGLSVGFSTYWNDIVAFRASSEFHDGSRSYFFNASFPYAKQDVLAVAVVALFGIVAVARRRTERVVVLAWLLAGLLAFNIGGLFWPHYYVQLLPPLALLAGIGATSFRSRPIAVVLCCAAAAPVVVSVVKVAVNAEPARYEKLYKQDRALAAFVRANSSPSDTIYALDSRADLYYLADRRTRFPYLWHHSPLLTPNGMALLRLHLTGPSRPRIVAVYRNPLHFDPSGLVSIALRRGYRLAWKPKTGIRVYVRRPVRFGTIR